MPRLSRSVAWAFAGALAVAPPIHAQSRSVPMFGEVPWGSSPAEVKQALTAKGYAFTEQNKLGDQTFTGKYQTTNTLVLTLYDSTKHLVKIGVVFVSEDPFPIYRDMLAVLTEKYGVPDDSAYRFVEPYYYGDGFEKQAAQLGKTHIFALWNWPGVARSEPGGLTLSISERGLVTVQYESPAWAGEWKRRQRRAATDF